MSKQSLPFTHKAYQALGHAERWARQRQDAAITPEHILFGLLQATGSQAQLALEAMRADFNGMTRDLEDALQTGPTSSAAGIAPAHDPLTPSTETKAILTEAAIAAQERGAPTIDTSLLLLALLRTPRIPAGRILRAQSITESALQLQPKLVDEAPAAGPAPEVPTLAVGGFPRAISPVFLLIATVTFLAGYLNYTESFGAPFTVFLFVTGGWIITLCLHEFGHALAAYWGGDKSVAHKGYLTLNPIKYTSSMYSIVFPLILMIMGGIGLPGGAVYINTAALRNRGWRSFVSAAGPLATIACASVTLIPFVFGIANRESHIEFWAGLALLAYLQIHAILLNLLPIPGLDGFGIVEPFLPSRIKQAAYSLGGYTYFLIFALLWTNNVVSRGLWNTMEFVSRAFNLDSNLVAFGFILFRFWVR